jgi:ABC-type multidrug transport system fused ATPase/permease subunit
VKIIKYLALEETVLQILHDVRSLQIKAFKRLFFLLTCSQGLTNIIPQLMPVVCFGVYALNGNEVNAQTVFPALLVFSMLFEPLIHSEFLVRVVSMFVVSWKRLTEFLQAEEFQKEESNLYIKDITEPAIRVKNATWTFEALPSTDDEKKVERNGTHNLHSFCVQRYNS